MSYSTFSGGLIAAAASSATTPRRSIELFELRGLNGKAPLLPVCHSKIPKIGQNIPRFTNIFKVIIPISQTTDIYYTMPFSKMVQINTENTDKWLLL